MGLLLDSQHRLATLLRNETGQYSHPPFVFFILHIICAPSLCRPLRKHFVSRAKREVSSSRSNPPDDRPIYDEEGREYDQLDHSEND